MVLDELRRMVLITLLRTRRRFRRDSLSDVFIIFLRGAALMSNHTPLHGRPQMDALQLWPIMFNRPLRRRIGPPLFVGPATFSLFQAVLEIA